MPSNGLVPAVQWIEQLLLGTMATIVAIMAVAVLGMLMLGGRLPWRRAGRAVLGIFLIFGAPLIAAGLMGAMPSDRSGGRMAVAPQPDIAPPLPRPPEPYNPYAGAALPLDW